MSLKYFQKLYSITSEEGFIQAVKYDFKATLFSLDSRLCRMIDYISDYFVIRKIRITNTTTADEIRKRMEASRKLTKERDLEMLLDL